jgi:cytochrome c553
MAMWIRVTASITIATFVVSQGLAAGNVTAGRQKALMCQTCHGLDGKAKIPEAPNLAGQSDIYLVKKR